VVRENPTAAQGRQRSAAALSARPRGFIEQWTARPETQAQLETIGTVLDPYAQQLLDRALYENILAQEQDSRQAVLSQLRRAMRPSARPSETELRRDGAATWGERPRPRLRLISRWSIIKGSLRGYATIEMPVGMKINDVPMLIGTKGAWPSLPAKPQLTADGRHKVGADGKPAYAAVLE
jgi:hypothetical protein